MRRSTAFPVFVMLAALASVPLARAAEGDLAGAHDYPGIERFAGSVITGYDTRGSAATRLQTAPFALGEATGDKRPEGRVTRIAYRTDPGPSMAEVARHFEAELGREGYETVFTCEAEVCGGIAFSLGIDVLFAPQMWVDGVNYRYFVGHKAEDGGGETWATVLVSHHLRPITAQLIVTEVGASR